MDRAPERLPHHGNRRSLSIRVDAELLDRLRALIARLEPNYQGFRISVSDAVRLALIEGVAALEAKYGRPPKNRGGGSK